jgi:cobalt-zinc-cadmium efflux system membrane fusion protein
MGVRDLIWGRPAIALASCVGALVVCVLAVIGLSQFSWWQASSPATAATTTAAPPNTVRVGPEQMHQLELLKVGVCSFRQLKTAIGQLAFNEDASTSVFTPFSGRVTRILARVGDDVKRGEPLFEIDSPEVVQAQTDLIAALHNRDKAKSALSTAQRQADRQSRLIRDRATSQREADQALNDLAAAQSDFKTAEGGLQAARNRLRVIIGRDQEEVDRVERERVINPLLIVTAPIDGTIITRKIGPGQFVRTDATEPHFLIADLTTMWLKAFVSEADIPFVQVGQEIEVRIVAMPQRPVHARIVAIGAASDPATRRIMVRSEIPNPDRLLKAEMFATFKISVGEQESVTGVPAVAIIREGGGARVWIQSEPQAFQLRNVKIGVQQDGCVEVQEGVTRGEVVVARGAIFVDNELRQ